MNKVFMAFAAGKESTETNNIKRYIGVAPVFIKAINPTKKELEAIYDTEIENEPEYLGEAEVGSDKHKVKQVRLDFIVNTDSAKCGIDMTTKVTFFLKREVRYNKDNSKIQVINKYGETTWLPIENAKNNTIPEQLNWFEPADFRPAYIGEEELTAFIKAYLNIPNKSYRKANGEVVELKDKTEAEARLDHIEDYFKGDFAELKNVISLQPNNKVKVLFGVRNTEDNKQYQAVYTQMFLKNNVNDYSRLDKDLQDRKNAGAYPTTEFRVCELTEYTVEATDFSTTGSDNDIEDSPWFK
jgi:hypothetical protein